MKKIFIRADSNEIIASGHIMRTKSIACQLQNLGAQVVFITSDDKSKNLLGNFQNIILNSTYNKLDNEISKISKILNNDDLVLLDSYFITPLYLKQIKNICKLAYMDDLNSFVYDVDYLINYSAFLDINSYKTKQNLAKFHLLGSKFTPLREEFANISLNKTNKNPKILLTSGNADICRLLPQILNCILKDKVFDKCEFMVISGIFNIYKDELLEFSKKYKNITIIQNANNMAELLSQCDIVISTAGSTLYECAACNTACICICSASNQTDAKLWGKEAMIYAGNAVTNINEVLQNTTNALKKLINEPNFAKKLAQKAYSLVDAKGAKHIAEFLLQTM